MKSFFAILAVASVAAAADYAAANSSSSTSSSATLSTATPSATPSVTPSALIPAGISPTCNTYLTALNAAPSVQSCVKPMLTALSSNGTSSLTSLCSTSSTCSSTTVRQWLADFKGNCSTDLSSNQDVGNLYAVLYAFTPYRAAVCSKGDDGKYCVQSIASNGTVDGGSSGAQTPLAASNGAPDATAFTSANLLFLGINPNMDDSSLCTTCTKNVITSYISFESSTPPANGLANMPLLASQTPIWNAIQSKCPANFISGALADAGASPSNANGASTSLPVQSAALMLAFVAAGVMAL